LDVARLRAECVRTGVREITVTQVRPGAGGVGRIGEVVARISPVALLASARVRLQRIAPKALYKEDAGQLQVPLRGGSTLANDLALLLAELIATPPSASSGTG
jgi:hypothetical protein